MTRVVVLAVLLAALLGATDGAAIHAQNPQVTAKTKLVLASGPAQVITLKTAAGKAVKTMKLGTYTVTVRDRGLDHNAHIVAPGYNRKTTLSFRGTQTWKVALKRAGTLRFLCDPHAAFGMRGTAKIVR